MPKSKCETDPARQLAQLRWETEKEFEVLAMAAVIRLQMILGDCKPEAEGRLLVDILRLHLVRKLPDVKGPGCLECVIDEIMNRPQPPTQNEKEGATANV